MLGNFLNSGILCSFCFIQCFLSFSVNFCNCFSSFGGFLSFSWMEYRNSLLSCFNHFSFLCLNFVVDNLINYWSMFCFLKFIGKVSLSSWFNICCVIICFCNCSQNWGVWALNCKSSWLIGTRNFNWWVKHKFWYMEMVDMICLSWVKMMMMFVNFFKNSLWRHRRRNIDSFSYCFLDFSFCFFWNSLLSSLALMRILN